MGDDRINENLTVKDIIEKDIFELLGASALSGEQKDELSAKMLETVNLRVIDRIDQSFSDEEVAEWSKLIEEGDQAKIDQFMKSKNINTEELMLEEALKYKAEITTYASYRQKNDQLQEGIVETLKSNNQDIVSPDQQDNNQGTE